MSLVEVLVAIGILSVVIAGMTSYMLSSSREVRALTETLAKLDIEKLLISSLADGAICSAELGNPALWTPGATPYNIDTTSAASLAATAINLNSLHASATAAAPAIVANGTAPSAMANSLRVNGIKVGNFQSTGIPDSYLADVTISFAGSIRQPSPIILKKTITTVPFGVNTKKITGCLGVVGAAAVGGLIKLSDYPAVFGGQRTIAQSAIVFGVPQPPIYWEVTPAGAVRRCSVSSCVAAFPGCNVFTKGSCGTFTLTSVGIQVFQPATSSVPFFGITGLPVGIALIPWQ